nr:cytochrome c oxidase subunit I [Gemmatimonadota bacterium]
MTGPVPHDHDPLADTWDLPKGFSGWMTQVNHRTIGLRFIYTALLFFVIAGLLGVGMRAQLAQSQLQILSPELYNQFMTLHGTTMMFLFAVPVMEGLGMYFVPLMIGARDMCFPRLSQFGYWTYLLSGLTLFAGALIADGPQSGWFAYVPLSTRRFDPGFGMDFWATALTFLEISALAAAVELVITILKQRAPGMSLNRMPLFVWSILVMSFMIIFAMPTLISATVMLALDRTLDTHFFNVSHGGHPLLWQHLFWFFGHPEVYIIFVPALGIVSSIVATFTRREVVGYTWLVLSTVAIGFVSFGLWVHHMFSTGLPSLGMSFFSVASMVIAIPSGIQIFAWLATIWHGRIILTTAMWYVLGFIVLFVLGGVTGVMVASVPFDQQVHDTYFVVAHFHYVIIGGSVFPLFGAFYYWFPKVYGRMLSERLGKWNFWTMFVGFNVTFFPMHITGLVGMPRRVYTYLPGLGWDTLNLISTVGAVMFTLGILLFFVNAVWSRRYGALAGDDPWESNTLEWATASPPEPYNFRHIPIIASRNPVWDDESSLPRDFGEGREPRALDRDRVAIAAMMDDRQRETLGTTILDAEP